MNLNCISDFREICRICLKYETNLKSLFKSEAAKMLNFCEFMKVQENEELPNHICYDCDKNLVVSYNFKQKCIISTEILDTFLTDKQLIVGTETEDPIIVPVKKEIQTLYGCSLCDVTYDSADFLQQHYREHEDCSVNEITNCNSPEKLAEIEIQNDKSPCEIENASTIEHLEDELTSFLDAKSKVSLPYGCNKCPQSFSEENDLDLHKSTHTLGDLLCVVCKKIFRTRQMLRRHIKTHMVNKPHICQKCGKSYAESHALTKHMRKHLGLPREKKYFCDDCGQGFSEPYYLKVHIRKHTGERPLVCDTCGKSFADPRSLRAHNMTHSGDKPYKCHFCPKAFSQSVNLTKHIRVHTGEKPYICSTCGRRFSQSSSLDKHKRTHTGEKPFACDSCPKRFAEKGTLVHHIRTHTGEKPYICEQCGKSFATSSELRLHDRKHSGIKKHICNVCEKDFSSPSNLLTHARYHTGEKPFECTICGRKFAERGSLKKHGMVVHSSNANGRHSRHPRQNLPPVVVQDIS